MKKINFIHEHNLNNNELKYKKSGKFYLIISSNRIFLSTFKSYI